MTVNIAPPALAQAAHADHPAGAPRSLQLCPPLAAHSAEAVRLGAIGSSPPAEVHDAIAVAAQSYEKLLDSGHELGFAIDSTTGRVSVEIRDTQGNLLWTVPPSKALDIAAGAPLD